VSAKRPDIVIRCTHGVQKPNGQGDVVQRFRWVDAENTWIATFTSRGRVRYYGSRPGPYRDEYDVADAIGSGPPHLDVKCDRCPDHVDLAGVRAQRTLTRLAIEGRTSLTLVGLRYVYRLWKL
jgi:hypothetical protein